MQEERRIVPDGFWGKAWWGEPRIKQQKSMKRKRSTKRNKSVKHHVKHHVVSDKDVQVVSTEDLPLKENHSESDLSEQD